MATNLIIQDSAGSATHDDANPVALADTEPGVASAATTLRLLNDDSGGAVDTASPCGLSVLYRDTNGDAVSEGFRPIDEGWIQLEVTGTAASGVSQPASGWKSMRGGEVLEIVDLAGGEWVEFRARYSPAAIGVVNFELVPLGSSLVAALGTGHSEAGRDGILTGIGDDSVLELLHGGAVTAQGAPDSTVNVADRVVKGSDGKLTAGLGETVTITDVDGDAVTLAASSGYWCTLSVASDGSITQTKSPQTLISAQDPDDALPVPADEEGLARVWRTDDDTISSGDITDLRQPRGFQASASSLNFTVSGGRALVANNLARSSASTVIALTDDDQTFVWLQPDGTLASNLTGLKPTPRSLLIWAPTAASGSIPDLGDRRPWIGGELHVLRFEFSGSLVSSPSVPVVPWPFDRDGVIWPFGLFAQVHDLGGNSAGRLRFEAFIGDGAGAWDSIFPDSGTDDRRLIVDFGDEPTVPQQKTVSGDPVIPTVLTVPRRRAMRATVTEATTFSGGTAPTGATLIVPVYLV